MRILFTQDTDWIERNPGQQHHVAERLQLRGHEIRVIDYEILWRTNKKKELLSKRQVFRNSAKIFKDADITVIRPSILKIPALDYLSMVFTYHREIKRQIKEFKPAVIVSQSLLSNYLAVKLSKKYKIPLVYQMNDVNPTIIPDKLLHPVGRMLEKTILKNANRVVVINEGLKEYATSMGANPERTYVIRAGIDVERYNTRIDGREIREKYGIQKDDALLFFMGWLYNFSGLKEVAIELAKKNNEKLNIKLLIVGDGDAFDDLKRIKEEYHLDNRVILAGKQPYEKIPDLISAADICILPAYNNEIMRDIVPIKMYEYMAVGKPVITTRLPGLMKEFDNNNGVLYVNKPEDVLKKAIELIETESIEKVGGQARAFVKNSDWETIIDEFERVLEQIIESG
jgi:glycosyltransferase involved in cell wall biosynthesis